MFSMTEMISFLPTLLHGAWVTIIVSVARLMSWR